jgi:uncharacterized protein (DUF2141 family)
MNKMKKLLWIMFIGMVSMPCAVAQKKGVLVIHVNSFETDRGFAVANIFRENDDIPRKYFLQIKTNIQNGEATLYFSNLPFGSYAVIVFQDENSNGILDHRFGPNEPMGFSNAWELTLFSGMPTFKKLKFNFTINTQTVVIPISRN